MTKVLKHSHISGPKLPFKLHESAMVPSPSGTGVVVIGGYNWTERKKSNALLELKGSSMEWVPLKQTLQYAREGHVAIPIPDDFLAGRGTYRAVPDIQQKN